MLPLTIIAIPMADLILAIVRRTWNGQSPFAADQGHLHHRLLEIGHWHSRAVLIMYFSSALIAFGTVAYSVHSAAMWIVFGITALSAIGLVLLLLPRFTPRAPRWAEADRAAAVPAPRAGRRGRGREGERGRGAGFRWARGSTEPPPSVTGNASTNGGRPERRGDENRSAANTRQLALAECTNARINSHV
ncbi:undecaprenyl-phosphate alpha-N-acetylglucosaminyl 1-phosphate transferase [Streptomyces narbonensis]